MKRFIFREGMKRFEQQVAIVTGGGDGIGLAIARRLAASGAFVVLFDLREAALRRAQESMEGRCDGMVVDVTDAAAVESAVRASLVSTGRVDILVNSAGITGKTNLKSHEVDAADFERVMRVNVSGSFLACRAVLPEMLRRGYGRILNIASIAGKEGNAGMVAYSSSKAAVIGMTKSMGKEYAESGVTINALAPAVIRTQMVDELPEQQVRYMTDKIPMKRCATLEECAAMAEFVVSPENSFCTGFTFDLSGGRAVY